MVKTYLLLIACNVTNYCMVYPMHQKSTLSKSNSVDNIALLFEGFSTLKTSGSKSLKRLSSHNVFEHLAKYRHVTPCAKVSNLESDLAHSFCSKQIVAQDDMCYLKKIVNAIKKKMVGYPNKIDKNLLYERIEKETNGIIAQTVREHSDLFIVE